MPIKRKKPPTPWLLLLLIPIGGLILWLVVTQIRPAGIADIKGILPQTTEVALTIDVRPQSWAFLDRLVSPEAKLITQEAIAQSPLFGLVRQSGMTWQRDVKPWSGGTVLAALLGSKEDDSTATVLLATSRNRGGRDFLDRYRRAQGGDFREQTYQGVTYHQLQGGTNVTAAVENFIIVATHPQALFQIIDVLQRRQQPLNVAGMDQNPGALVQGIIRGSSQLFAQNTPQKLDALTFTVAPLAEGLSVNVRTILSQPLPFPQRPSQLVGMLPQDTFFVVSTKQVVPKLSLWPGMAEQVQAAIAEHTPFNWEQDILSWLGGELAIGAVPTQEGVFGQTAGFGLVVLAEGQREETRGFFERLDQWADNAEGGLFPRGVTLQPRPDRTVWQVGDSVAASHGAVGQAVYWATGELGNRLNTGDKLPTNSQFQTITRGLRPENGGHFYLDMATARTIFSQKIAPPDWQEQPWFQNTMTVLNSIEGIAFVQSQQDDRTADLGGQIILRKPS